MASSKLIVMFAVVASDSLSSLLDPSVLCYQMAWCPVFLCHVRTSLISTCLLSSLLLFDTAVIFCTGLHLDTVPCSSTVVSMEPHFVRGWVYPTTMKMASSKQCLVFAHCTDQRLALWQCCTGQSHVATVFTLDTTHTTGNLPCPSLWEWHCHRTTCYYHHIGCNNLPHAVSNISFGLVDWMLY